VEVERAEVNHKPAGWGSRLDDGDVVEVWPRYPRQAPEPDARFVLDVHLGKLARLLRLVGFDADYDQGADDPSLAATAAQHNRILLTRDRGLLMRSMISRGRFIRSIEPEQQTSETLRAFDLAGRVQPFSRCMECGGRLVRTEPKAREVPPRVHERHTEFRRCPRCRRLYWAGTHHGGLEDKIGRILEAAEPPG
jgi:uncharacterized protein with PIN domain